MADTLNGIIDTASRITAEFEQTSKIVGRQSKINARLTVSGLDGSWVRLVGLGNSLIEDLVSPMNEVVRVIGAVSSGDLSQTVPMEVGGKRLEGVFKKSAGVVNAVVEKLGTFSYKVTRVVREVGMDRKLGSQAAVSGVAGTWKDLTENINRLATNLTTQVCAIAEVSTAVTKGDLTRSITVEAKGEVSDLKNNVNEMIKNLRATTSQDAEQDWLKTNLAKFTKLLQGQRDLIAVSRMILSELAPSSTLSTASSTSWTKKAKNQIETL